MKKFAVSIVALFSFLMPTAGLAQSSAEAIKSFGVDITVLPNADIEVSETIVYDFGSNDKRGIFRDIPLRYKGVAGLNYNLGFTFTAATKNGAAETHKITKNNRNVNIRLGQPDTFISGTHVYKIDYTVSNAVRFFDDYDELYWNVTGNDWMVPINQAIATVTVPAGASLLTGSASCFVGKIGSTAMCDIEARETWAGFTSNQVMSTGQGMTIAVALPKGAVNEPTAADKIWWYLKNNAPLGVPLIVFMIMFGWWRKVKKANQISSIITQYQPPAGISPLWAGVIIDNKVNNHDIAAAIVDLAISNIITISHVTNNKLFKQDDYVFKAVVSSLEIADTYQVKVAKVLFGGVFDKGAEARVSQLKNDIEAGESMRALYESARKILTSEGFIDKKTNTRRGCAVFFGMFLFMVAFALVAVVANWAISLVVSAIIICFFAFQLVMRTPKGVKTYSHLLGFKRFLEVTEADRYEFFEQPESAELFMKWLPYAIAFKVEKQWAKQFKDIVIPKPDWYQDSQPFNAAMLANLSTDLRGFSASTKTTASSSATSSGSFSGGFSGGGFGGGGGGSW